MALQIIFKKTPASKSTLEMFAAKLLDKIIHASSAAAIERYIAVALKALDSNKVNGYIIQRFIDRVTRYLESHLPENDQQLENTKIARQRLQEFRRAIAAPAK